MIYIILLGACLPLSIATLIAYERNWRRAQRKRAYRTARMH